MASAQDDMAAAYQDAANQAATLAQQQQNLTATLPGLQQAYASSATYYNNPVPQQNFHEHPELKTLKQQQRMAAQKQKKAEDIENAKTLKKLLEAKL